MAAQEVGRRLLELKRPGKIINIASIISFIGNINIAAYACTKGGVLQMTKAMSNEWASKGINVNCICPGYENFPPLASSIWYRGLTEFIGISRLR